MAQLFILLVSLLLIGLLTLAMRRRKPIPPLPQIESLPAQRLGAHLRVAAASLPWQRYRKLPQHLPAVRRLNRLLRNRGDLLALAYLQENGRKLLLQLMSLREQLHDAPSLPAPALGSPRLLHLCQRYLLLGGSTRADALLAAAKDIQSAVSLTLDERLLLPLGLRMALTQQLDTVLKHLSLCLAEYQRGQRLGRQLRHARRPMQLLSAQRLSLAETHGMLTYLTAFQEASLLTSIEDRMTKEHCSIQQITDLHTHQQTLLADHLRRILDGLQALEKLDWSALLEPEDPLHRLLLQDPTDTYPRMDAESRSLYRQRVSTLARLFRADELHLTQEALTLCTRADPDGLRDHVGWYLLEPAGIRALCAQLHTRRGLLSLWLHQAAPWLYRTGLGLAALGGGLRFLNAGHPVWALPVFLGVWSCLTHWLADILVRWIVPPQPLPRIAIDQVKDDARVLVVLPTVLQDSTQAVSAVRHLLLARHAFPTGAVDCLLLADYNDCMTQTSSGDDAIVTAARTAITAADGDDSRFLYLHRRRIWDGKQHTYMGRGREHGALECLNRLIVHGECSDDFDAATLPPSAFHRRYAYVLALDSQTTPGPDSLLPLLGALIHPLNERRHTAEGVRGISIAVPRMEPDAASIRSRAGLWAGDEASCNLSQRLTGRSVYRGKGLYRPDALTEATEGWLSPHCVSHDWLEGELSGCAQDASQAFFRTRPVSTADQLRRLYRRTWSIWQMLPWLLPHVKTPDGVLRNPLSSHSKYTLRQSLRRSLAPICRLLLLLYAVLARSLPLGLLALLGTELPLFSLGRFVVELAELPLGALTHGEALLRSLWQSYVCHEKQLLCQPASLTDANARFLLWESWGQGLSALCIAVAALAIQPISPFGLMLALVFACFPLVRPWLDAPLRLVAPPTRQIEDGLLEVCQATWRFFEETVTEATHHLPPEHLQLKPWRGAAKHVTPAGISLYLLSCLAATELGLINTEALCSRIAHAMDSLERLSLWHGLPYKSYSIDNLQANERFVSSTECGILCACLMTLAQGLRSSLPHTPKEFISLSQRVDDFSCRMELSRLYDAEAQLFSVGYDVQQSVLSPTHHDLYASEALLLSFVAVMRREVPLSHLSRLNRAMVRIGRDTPYVSQRGTAAEYLLPYLLLPTAPGTGTAHTLQAIIRSQRRRGADGMFGMSTSAYWNFDPHLNYLQDTFGVPEAALGHCNPQAVIAPYAAALCLPFAPDAAFDSLMHLRSHSMMGRLGYFDSLDLDPAHLPNGVDEAPVQYYSANHQGMLLCALCNTLAENILVQHFSALPVAAAVLPLLQEKHLSRLTLPPRLIYPETLAPREPPFRRSAQPLSAPMDAHIIGSPDAMLLMSAQGFGVMRSHGMELTRFTGDPTQVEGIQFYLHDGLTSYRLTDPALSGDTIFGEGCIRFIRTCGQLQTTLTALTDPVKGAFLHVIEVFNPTSQEHSIDLASFLVPGLYPTGQPDQREIPMETARPEERVLTVTRSDANHGSHLTLCHAVSTHEQLMGLAAETDRIAFQGRNQSLLCPAALTAPLRDGFIGSSAVPCASFRVRLHAGARGRASVIFVTRLANAGEAFSLEALTPRLSDMGSLLPLSRLLSRTITDSLGLNQSKAAELSRLFGALLWHSQPRQGAITPLTCPVRRLVSLGLNSHHSLLMVMVHSEDCAALVRDASDTVQWLSLLGQPAALCILCEGSHAAQAKVRADEVLLNRPASVLLASQLEDGMRETLEAASHFILYEGSGSVAAQLDAQLQAVPVLFHRNAPPAPPLDEEALDFATDFGGFQPDTGDYVIRLDSDITPVPWYNPLASGTFGTRCAESGLYGTIADCRSLTLNSHDLVCPAVAECAYLSDGTSTFTPTPLPLGHGMSTRVQISPGITTWRSLGHGLDMSFTAASIPETAFGCRSLRLNNMTQKEIRLTLTIAARFTMGQAHEASYVCMTTTENGVTAVSPSFNGYGCLTLVEGSCKSRMVSPLAFHGFGNMPDLSAPMDEAGTVGLLTLSLSIPAGGSQAISWLLGTCQQMDELESLLARLKETGTSIIYREVRQQGADQLGRLTIRTPDKSLDLLMNRLLPWQVRIFQGTEQRIAFSRSLQALVALTYTEPELFRTRLLACACHQYTEGDVQHLWQPPRSGLRTYKTEDQLLLPFITCWYVQRTGDRDVLAESIPWLLGEVQGEVADTPPSTLEQDSLYTHCLRALTSIRLGPHGLPLANGAESLWLAMLYACTLRLFAQYAADEARTEMEDVRAGLLHAIEHYGWDGSWYLPSLPDSRTSNTNLHPESILDCLTQCWAVLAFGVTERTAQAMEHAWRQFTALHRNVANAEPSAVWMLLALCDLGWVDRAWMLVQSLNPLLQDHSEPYALAEGASSASWLYAFVLEKLLGFEKRSDLIRFHPMVPAAWESFTITLQWGSSTWRFHIGRDEPLLTCDGERITSGRVTLRDDSHIHEVRVPLRQGV